MLFRFLERLGFSGAPSPGSTAFPRARPRAAFSNALRGAAGPAGSGSRLRRPSAAGGEPSAPVRLEGPADAGASPGSPAHARLSRRPRARASRGAQEAAARVRRCLRRGRVARAGPGLLHADGLRGDIQLARSSKCAVGRRRYDELFGELGGPPVPAIGFSIGEDRLISVLPTDPRKARPVFFVVPDSPSHFPYALGVSGDIRACLPDAVVETDLTGRGFRRGWPAPRRSSMSRPAMPLRRKESGRCCWAGRERIRLGDREEPGHRRAADIRPQGSRREARPGGGSWSAKRQPAGELRAADAGRRVVLKGWVGRRRDLGELIFLTVRDRSGTVQAVFDKARCPAEAVEAASQARSEDVVSDRGRGRLARRGPGEQGVGDGRDRSRRLETRVSRALGDAALRDRGPHERDRGAAPPVPVLSTCAGRPCRRT